MAHLLFAGDRLAVQEFFAQLLDDVAVPNLFHRILWNFTEDDFLVPAARRNNPGGLEQELHERVIAKAVLVEHP
jgi:hypothetical protein